jgi:hypothetical protein
MCRTLVHGLGHV